MAVLAGVGDSFQQTAASGPLVLALGACLLAGLVSFASPCVVPLVPGYLSYLAGLVGAEAPPVTPREARERRGADAPRGPAGGAKAAGRTGIAEPNAAAERRAARAGRLRIAGAAGLFVLGFTVVFVLATATVFGLIQTLNVNRELLQRIGGVLTILMGLVFIGLVPALQRDTRMEPRRITGLLGAPLLGGVFALGWTPCLGPTLSGVMAVAAGTEGATAARGVTLIVAYCLGLGLPFVVLAFGSAGALRGVGWLRRNSRTIQLIGGILLVAVGVALVTGAWDQFVAWVRDAFVSEVTLPI
ncbi:cytochrome c biogenesis CcdA family protein [Nocardia harenae]|uniref:cytochrome c biogenesis CcdA family protein n=1 Tax=Nocardia harenae TaxID=358707 RepID=UPI000A000E76|nr:cytochrome c biogenesis CcdA family protein [Nocardia harenae]